MKRRASTCWFTPQMPAIAGDWAVPKPGLPLWAAGTQALGPSPTACLPWCSSRELGKKGRGRRKLDTGIPSHHFTCCATRRTPRPLCCNTCLNYQHTFHCSSLCCARPVSPRLCKGVSLGRSGRGYPICVLRLLQASVACVIPARTANTRPRPKSTGLFSRLHSAYSAPKSTASHAPHLTLSFPLAGPPQGREDSPAGVREGSRELQRDRKAVRAVSAAHRDASWPSGNFKFRDKTKSVTAKH